MRYATWRLSFQDDVRYGTGPEHVVADRGGRLSPCVVQGAVESGVILGYALDPSDLTSLEQWEVHELTAAEALAFAQVVVPGASLREDGTIDLG